jgi:serine protease Do
MNRSTRACTTLVVALFVFAATAPVRPQTGSATGSPGRAPQSPPRPAPQRLSQISEDFGVLVAAVSPSVVQVIATGYSGMPSREERTPSVLSRQRAGGSGVVLSADGYIVTNAHVIVNARRVRVVLPPAGPAGTSRSIVRPSGRLLDATVVGFDRETDLAVLKVAEQGLTALQLADSDELRQGHLVLAFGSPLGLDNSVTLGVVSAVGRQRAPEDPMVYVQTDAPTNPGNSGGPLVDAAGRIVGINTYIVSQSGGHEGVGFAVPSNIVRTVFEQLRTTGRVRRGTLGVLPQTITPVMAAGLGLGRTGGVILADVAAGGPGARAGLQPGDVVLTLDGKPMENARQFDVNLYSRRVGDVVTLEVERGKEMMRIPAAIGERPGDPVRFADVVDAQQNQIARLGILGVEVGPDRATRLPQLRAARGVLVAALLADAPAGREGLEAGDVIIAMNSAPLTTLADLRTKIDALPGGGACVLQVQRGDVLVYVVLEPE